MASLLSPQHADPVRALLGRASDAREAEERAAREVFEAAAAWALAHPASGLDDAAHLPGTEREMALAGEGAPLVAEFCVEEFALAIGVSADSGRIYLGDALEVCSRLPRCWARLLAGDLPVWRARRIAQATRSLSPAAADLADRRLAPFAHSLGSRGIERTVELARAQAGDDLAVLRDALADDPRCFDIHTGFVDLAGNVEVRAVLGLLDALQLDGVLGGIADHLRDLGCDAPLDVRRSMAAGELARREIPLPLGGSLDTDADTGAGASLQAPTETPRQPRVVQLHVHLQQRDDGPVDTPFGRFGPIARVEGTRSPLDVETLRSWCADPDTQLVVRPVLDLAAQRHSESYEAADLLREQVVLRDVTCVFPHCSRPARSADLDHIVPFDAGGPTTTANLASNLEHPSGL